MEQVYQLALWTSERAMARAASVVHQDLKQGLNTLATLTCLAPFVGMLGTCWAIGFDTFLGFDGDKATGLAMIAHGIARSGVPAALGLLVGVLSLWSYRYLEGRLADFDREMAGISLRVVNQLAAYLGQLRVSGPTHEVVASLPYLEAYSPSVQAEGSDQRRILTVSGALILASWCVELFAYLKFDRLPRSEAMSMAFGFILITFGCSCLSAYAVWVDLMHRRSNRVVLIAAAICFFWCAAGLLFPALRL